MMSVVTTSRKPCEDRMVEEVWWAVNSVTNKLMTVL